MFPSSQKDMNKFCCDHSTCPNRNQRKEDSFLPSSSVEEIYKKVEQNISWNKIDKETQKTPSVTSSSSEESNMSAKIYEKSSETYFDRNYQNISFSHNKSCPSNSTQTSITESQMCTVMFKCPSSLICKVRDIKRPQICPLPKSVYETTTNRKNCSCNKLDITSSSASSSSSSLTSEHFPVKLSLKMNSVEKERHLPKVKHQTKQVNPTPRQRQYKPPSDSSKCEQYYSCGSEESENEDFVRSLTSKLSSRQRSKKDENFVILELLHEVVHLINKDNPIRDEALRITQVTPSSLDERSSKMTTNESEVHQEQKEAEVVKPSQISQSTQIIWPTPPCLCYAYGMALAQDPPFHIPCIQPYNLISPTVDGGQIPVPFLYEETEDSFKDCSSGNTSLQTVDQVPNNLTCICSTINDVCPKHGPLKQMLKNSDIPFSRLENKIVQTSDISVAEEDKPEKLPSPAKIEEEDVNDEQQSVKALESSFEPINIEEDDEKLIPAKNTEDVDEELQPFYEELKIFDPSEMHEPSPDCLMEYDDEDPSYVDLTEHILKTKNGVKDHKISSSIELAENETDELNTTKENKIVEENRCLELETSPDHVQGEINKTPPVTEEDISPFVVDNSFITGGNKYNFLPEIDRADDPKQIIRYNESAEEFDCYYHEEESDLLDEEFEYELAKEKIAEKLKKKKSYIDDSDDMALATIKQVEGEGSPQEMKFFIDSLLMDFEAMEYAQCRSQFEKNICTSKTGLNGRKSFPVTITDVTDLGASSLYVKWIIHDCFGIGGYEIYTDGYLTNCYYNSRHDAAVVTNVDITLPHKITLVAQPCTNDESIELMCNISKNKQNKIKSLPWKTDVEKERKTFSALWTPSIFLYDPITCRATVAPPIMRDNF